MPVKIIQSASDEGKGLVKYVEKELGAHHSPDLFHVQQELTRATSALLRAKVKQAEKSHHESTVNLERLEREREKSAKINKTTVSWSDLDKKITEADLSIEVESQYLARVKKYCDDARDAKKALGAVYHPYDLNTGTPQSAEEINEALETQFSITQSAALEEELSENCIKRLDKAHRVFDGMINTITFFWLMVKQMMTGLRLSLDTESLMRDILIPGYYLQMASKKAKTAEDKRHILKTSTDLLARLDMLDNWCTLAHSTREDLKDIKATDKPENIEQLVTKKDSPS